MARSAGILLLALSAALAGAQEDKSVSASSVKRLDRAPVNHSVLEIKLPRPTEHRLSNGLTVVLLERHKLPTLHLALWINASSLNDPKDLPGLAQFTTDMLREGTAKRTSAQLASEIDSLGATVEASTEFGTTYSEIAASGFAEDADRLLDLISDMIVNPAFPDAELEKYKTRQLAALEEARSDPSFLAREQLFRDLYGSHPAAVTSATPASVKAVSVAQLKDFHSRYYLPGSAMLGIVGDFDSKAMLALLEQRFANWKGQPNKASAVPAVPSQSAHLTLVDRPDSVQTNIMASFMSVPRKDPDFFPTRVLNKVLGEGATGRLFLHLREEKGYTYGAYSYIAADTYPRPLIASTEVRTQVTADALRDLVAEFQKLREEPVPGPELDDARRSIVANFALSLERPGELLELWMRSKHNGLGDNYWDQYPAEIAKVDAATVQRTAKKYLDPSRMQLVCVGNGKEIKGGLAKFGPIEAYDADGKKMGK